MIEYHIWMLRFIFTLDNDTFLELKYKLMSDICEIIAVTFAKICRRLPSHAKRGLMHRQTD